MTRVAVTGTTGRVGAALARHFSADHEVIALPRSRFDLADPAGMARVLEALDCDVFLNPAGVTGLEACLDEPALAQRVNGEAPGEIAAWAARRGVRLIHFSTDYVLGGREPGLHDEAEPAEPLSDYGRSKRAGEVAVLAQPGTCVLRVSWVFGPEKASFVDAIRTAAMAGGPLTAVADKFSLPTFTADLATWVMAVAKAEVTGILHACNSGEPVSWHDLAEEVTHWLHATGHLATCPAIERQTLAGVPSLRAVRPRHSAMATSRLATVLGVAPRPWREALAEHLTSGEQ
jgi:dTDP-4-dehydrorhamnose reductase